MTRMNTLDIAKVNDPEERAAHAAYEKACKAHSDAVRVKEKARIAWLRSKADEAESYAALEEAERAWSTECSRIRRAHAKASEQE